MSQVHNVTHVPVHSPAVPRDGSPLFFRGEIVEEPVAGLEHRDVLEVDGLDLEETEFLLKDALKIASRFLRPSCIGALRLSEKNCGVYLHDVLNDGPTDPVSRLAFVGDIGHAGCGR